MRFTPSATHQITFSVFILCCSISCFILVSLTFPSCFSLSYTLIWVCQLFQSVWSACLRFLKWVFQSLPCVFALYYFTSSSVFDLSLSPSWFCLLGFHYTEPSVSSQNCDFCQSCQWEFHRTQRMIRNLRSETEFITSCSKQTLNRAFPQMLMLSYFLFHQLKKTKQNKTNRTVACGNVWAF